MKREAMFYEREKGNVRCCLCPHNCVIKEGCYGKCQVRINEGGRLYTINYGEVTAIALDPIEKKPLHFYRPSTFILSVGTFGCNFTCSFCQNYSISQQRAYSEFLSKEKLVDLALNTRDNIGIAFTYNEPTIWYEYVYDCAKLLKESAEGYSIVLVTNGYIREEPLKKLLPYVDAMNIDLKSFKDSFYKRLCGGTINPILRSIEIASKSCHVEVTTLFVNGDNDTLEEVEEIAKFLSNMDREIPLHLTRYFPRYKHNNPPTDIEFMERAAEVAGRYLSKVALGNI